MDMKFLLMDHMSTSDIVDRLAVYADKAYANGSYVQSNVILEAADEIMQLRENIRHLTEIVAGQDLILNSFNVREGENYDWLEYHRSNSQD